MAEMLIWDFLAVGSVGTGRKYFKLHLSHVSNNLTTTEVSTY